jgi:hypothetical protein
VSTPGLCLANLNGSHVPSISTAARPQQCVRQLLQTPGPLRLGLGGGRAPPPPNNLQPPGSSRLVSFLPWGVNPGLKEWQQVEVPVIGSGPRRLPILQARPPLCIPTILSGSVGIQSAPLYRRPGGAGLGLIALRACSQFASSHS